MRALRAVSDTHVSHIMFKRWQRGLEISIEEEYASVEIQRYLRGYLYGKLPRYRAQRMRALRNYEQNEEILEERKRQNIAACTLQKRARIFLASRTVHQMKTCALSLRRSKVVRAARGANQEKTAVVNAYFESQYKRLQNEEATRIQAWFRAESERLGTIRARRAIKQMAHAVKRNAITKIQARWRGIFLRRLEGTIRLQAIVRGWHTRFKVRKERRKRRLDGEAKAKEVFIFNALRTIGFKRYAAMKNVCETLKFLGVVTFPDSREVLREATWEEREFYQLCSRRKRLAKSQDRFEKLLFTIEEYTTLLAKGAYRRIRDGFVIAF